MLLWIYFSLLAMHLPLAASVSFSFDFLRSKDSFNADLQYQKDAFFHSDRIELTKNDVSGVINYSSGRVWYAHPVPLWDHATGVVASFVTNFSFVIKPDDRVAQGSRGDGMAFFLGSYPSAMPPVSRGGSLGIVNDSLNNMQATGDDRIIAVEFDTYLNPDHHDSSSNHIGIDINSIVSVAATTPEKDMASGTMMTAKISYDSITRMLDVALHISGTPYKLNNTADMRGPLPEEVSIGFCAATGGSVEVHQLLSWSFTSTLDSVSRAESAPASMRSRDWLLVDATACLLLLCAIVGLLLWQRRKCCEKCNRQTDTEFEGVCHDYERGVAKRYGYAHLAHATNNFAEEERLGRGGFGTVYRGHLSDQDLPVAVKVFSPESSVQGRKEFENEVRTISRLRHRNLVQLLGWCDSCRGLLLVYELVPERSLDKHIYGNDRLLTWPERYNIIVGLGSALVYLHIEWGQCVVHGDIKPSNIMLDSSYSAKLGDFGLARVMDHGAGWQTTEAVLGTAGYIDPEFVNTRRRSPESDVYSFGVVLLEIVSGRPPVVLRQEEGVTFMLLKWIWSLYGRNAILDAVDERLRGNDDELSEQQMFRALVVGLWCAHPDWTQRPSIKEAMRVLPSSEAELPVLPNHMYTTVPSVSVREHSSSRGNSQNSTDLLECLENSTTYL